MHTDLPATKLRGYVQLSTTVVPGGQVLLTNPNGTPINLPNGTQARAVEGPQYLGPAIVATKNRPVRILFRNLLPTGTGGNLFLPVDTTVMGSGMGPDLAGTLDPDPQNPMCGEIPKPFGCYSENRATLHLHGGVTPWISDGTPHQWTTPAGEATPYPKGVSVQNVPDMPAPGPGAMTFFYTNQQSARLLFYHDHAYGITRLNVYAGEAAPYVITDPTEQALVTAGVIPPAADTIPLVIQDKTFVPSAGQLFNTDPLWDAARWGGEGNLWLPHVYVPAQNPGDSTGVNDFGRWAYGPWFWPPTLDVDNGPIPNPYFDPNCDSNTQWCEPPEMPGTPFVSMGMESFHDTPVVNGTAYPTVTVQPKSYRFRILNAANDRFFNLSLYVADAVQPTEVALNPAEVAAALNDPTIFPTPDPARSPAGPDWIQFATEGGFLPAPTVIPAQPTTWVTDPTVFNAGNVDLHSLLLGPAERADVVVDFSAFRGQTLILYNDAPAAFPARDPRYDYYTGNADLTATGGAPTTLPGYGPNTRTVMQIKVANSVAAPPYNLADLQAAFAHKTDGSGVFEAGQAKPIVGQGAYNSALGTTFRTSAPRDGFARISDTTLSFDSFWGPVTSFPLQPKAIQDEMGEAFEKDYGRMSGNLGLEAPNAQAGLQLLMLYPYPNPPTEVLTDVVGQGLPVNGDGTQIWKITHNGVDTHPIHFHLFDVQLINRVGWDGIIRRPEPNELGWKDTVRVSPLEDTIVALRPHLPTVPWDLPNSVRLIDPTMPEGAVLASATQALAQGLPITSFAPNGEPIDIFNHYVNYGHEYVWHCHILSHEEMDMMRPIVVASTPKAPTGLAAVRNAAGVLVSWTDASLGETGFTLQRATDAGFTLPVETMLLPNTASFTDPVVATTVAQTFYYRVLATNTAGDTFDYTDPNLNEGAFFPTATATSPFSNTATVTIAAVTRPNAPSGLTASLAAPQNVVLNWTDNSNNEDGFRIERATGAGAFAAVGTVAAGVRTFNDGTVALNTTYSYRVIAFNAAGDSNPSNTVTVGPPTAPASLVATPSVLSTAAPTIRLTWSDRSNNESGFTIQRSTSSLFTTVTTFNVAANATSFTDTTVGLATRYYYRIRANNVLGSSAWSATATALSAGRLPSAPRSLVVTSPTATTALLTWADDATNELGFYVERSIDGGVTWVRIATLPANTRSYTAVGVTAGTRFRVQAYNAYGTSTYSNVGTKP
jgi:FtsP/CotA-like multicopper oxidase with cupredoxin domain